MEIPTALTPCPTPAWSSSTLLLFGSAPPPHTPALTFVHSSWPGLAHCLYCSLEVQLLAGLSGFRPILENCEAEPMFASPSY